MLSDHVQERQDATVDVHNSCGTWKACQQQVSLNMYDAATSMHKVMLISIAEFLPSRHPQVQQAGPVSCIWLIMHAFSMISTMILN